eukprot:2466542-Pleurochrysis_carterae.AAC.2
MRSSLVDSLALLEQVGRVCQRARTFYTNPVQNRKAVDEESRSVAHHNAESKWITAAHDGQRVIRRCSSLSKTHVSLLNFAISPIPSSSCHPSPALPSLLPPLSLARRLHRASFLTLLLLFPSRSLLLSLFLNFSLSFALVPSMLILEPSSWPWDST